MMKMKVKVFQTAVTIQNQVNQCKIHCGLGSDSTIKLHIEGTAQENVEVNVKFYDNCMYKRK